MIRRLILALLLMAGLVPAIAQAPPPVPALPDAPRVTQYTIASSNCNCPVQFALYADGTDVDNWIQVFIGTAPVLSTDPTFGWSLTTPVGPLATIPRPITTAVLKFNSLQSGNITIVGARRPRRISQFSENRGVAARDLNQAITDEIAMLREDWDLGKRSVAGQPGETLNLMPPSATRKNTLLGFDANGQPLLYPPIVNGIVPTGISAYAVGAKCDGVTDDSVALNAALGSGQSITIPNAACRVASTLIIAPGAQLSGVQFNPQEPATGSRIQCALSLTPCINISVPLSGSSSIGGQTVTNLSITRDAGTIPAGTICVLSQGFKVTLQNVNCNAHAIGFETTSTGIYGIVTFGDHLWTCNITDSDIVQNGYAEFKIDNSRFGCNGTIAPSTSHNNYIKITGGNSGPNTLWVTNSQFNDINNPNCWINWTGITVTSPTASEYKFIGNHYENTGSGGPATRNIFCSDSSLANISRVWFNDNMVLDNNGNAHAWNMGTSNLGDWTENGNKWYGFGTNGWNLSISGQLLIFRSIDETFNNPAVTVTGSGIGAQAASFEGDTFGGGLTIAGSFGTAFPTKFTGIMGGGSVTNTATTPVEIDIPGYSITSNSSSLGLTFGGVAATLGTKQAGWTISGNTVTWYFFLQLSALGAGSGAAVITGLPFNAQGGTPGGTNPNTVLCTNMAALGGPVIVQPNANATTVQLVTQGATGPGSLTNSNFTSTSICTGQVSYQFK